MVVNATAFLWGPSAEETNADFCSGWLAVVSRQRTALPHMAKLLATIRQPFVRLSIFNISKTTGMIRLRLRQVFFPFLMLGTLLSSAHVLANIKLPALVRDSMILQRDTPLRLWGWAAPGEKVTVRCLQQIKKTTTGTNGEWSVTLAPLTAGGPYTIQISGQNKITLKEVLAGDVWLCAGQSNMVHQLGIHRDLYENEIRSTNNTTIRQFWVPTTTSLTGPNADLPAGAWKAATPQNLPDFSAVAYFFAKKVQASQHIPIGIINASVGGTPIQAWISEQGLRSFPDLAAQIEKNKDTSRNDRGSRGVFSPQKPPIDKGMVANPKWYEEGYQPVNWRNIHIPGYWEDQGANNLNGIVWYRREINIPAAWASSPAKLVMGRIVDADEVYINGRQVGKTTYMYPQRRYQLPAGTLKAGKNILVVRITNNNGKGGFVPDKPYALVNGTDSIDLKGTWQYKVSSVFAPPTGRGGGGGGGNINPQSAPAALYNAMVAGATNYAIKGVLWYQGEANIGQPQLYSQLMHAIINDWRAQFRQPSLPFLFVQLPNMGDIAYVPSESGWAETREAQASALALPHTGMAVTIDVGDWNDIHPDRKKEVGERLALLALKKLYNQNNLVAASPLLQSASLQGNKVLLTFDTDGSSLQSGDGEPLNTFAIAGADKKFVWAQAIIENGKVLVWSDDIAEPRYVRYAWADNPDFPNLFNKEGLPAAPFQIKVE